MGSELSGVLVIRNLSCSLALRATSTRVVGTPQMVFINPITTIHVNMTTNRPLMNSMAIGEYRSADATNPRGGY